MIDEKIAQLQQRLAKKRHINQQLSYQMQSQALTGPIGLNNQFNTLRGTSGHSYKRLPINQRTAVPNIAAVEPIQRQPQSVDQTEVCDTYFELTFKFYLFLFNSRFTKVVMLFNFVAHSDLRVRNLFAGIMI